MFGPLQSEFWSNRGKWRERPSELIGYYATAEDRPPEACIVDSAHPGVGSSGGHLLALQRDWSLDGVNPLQSF